MARQDTTTSGLIGFLMGLLSGLILGSTLGLLFAPHRGDVTRRKIRRRAEDIRDQVEEAAESVTE